MSSPPPSLKPAPAPFVLGGRVAWSAWSIRDAAVYLVVVGFSLIPVRGLYRATGSSMEEGFMLVFPRLVQEGRVPNVDFLHLYGPGSLDVLAGWYSIFGDTLESQRTFGLMQNLGIVLALTVIGRAWGRVAAVVAGVIAALMIMTPIGLSALAWHGGLALGLWAIIAALRARAVPDGRRWWVTAGVLAGLALSFRPDLVVALALAIVFLLRARAGHGLDRRSASIRTASIRTAVGAAIGLLPMWVHLVVAGIGPALEGMVLDPVFELRAGRELPRPPSFGEVDGALQAVAEGVPPWWGLPAPSANHQLFFWFFAVILIAAAVPLWAWRRRRRSVGEGGPGVDLDTVMLAVGLFGLGILPQALQRPDSTHLAWVAVVSWPMAALVITSLVRSRLFGGLARRVPDAGGPSWWQRPALAGGLCIGVLMLVVCPFYTYRHYVLHARVSVGDLPLPFLVERDERRFWFGDPFVANALNEMIVDLEARTEPGDRLIVGPADLRRTIYSDVAIYYLFPELEPATYYIEMDPGLADVEGSGLAEDIETADVLVLTNIWTGWNEPNASGEFQSEEHNRAVADSFCLVSQFEENLVLVFERCAGGGGVEPQDVPGRYPLPEDPDA